MPAADYSSYHQLPGTGADGTKLDNFIDAVQATINALDKNNLAAGAGILASQLADPTTGKVLGSSGSACAAVFPPGYEIPASFKSITASVNIVSTNHAAPTAILTPAGAATYDGTACYLEAFFPFIQGVSGVTVNLILYDGATELDLLGLNAMSAGSLFSTPTFIKIPITPSAGTHTYKIGGYLSGAGTAVAGAGAGGANTNTPAWMRVVKA